ncbi:hypothetical protein [Leptothoe spongobia]|uniref:Uncharacterized protein n=1 Tax=Leptothoe spongobia TAU-MAC 1115 TaxID=1967444 RepID=A0A947DGI9_9CYAN|nr:hypothetical protein [Leptothoe spongobia]MBT9316249.1 hypothetical protein [Leptothoe spongobia TAU-MAC 1115]
MQFIIKNIGLIITIVSAVSALIGWGISRVRKSYGLERDINHLKKDYKALSGNFNTLYTELERRLDTVETEFKVLRAVNEALIDQGAK